MRRRRRFSADQWAAWIEAQPQSGMSIERFCGSIDVPQSSFHRWKKILRDRQRRGTEAESVPPAADFVQLVVPNAKAQPQCLEVSLPGRITVRVPVCDDVMRKVFAVLIELTGNDSDDAGDGSC